VRVVLDTNVLVSALKTHSGNCAVILDLAVSGDLEICADQRILDEYERVCGEPRLRLDQQAIRTVLGFLRTTVERVVPRPLDLALPDSDDLPFIEVAAQAGAVLITGNKKHFPADSCRTVSVFNPAEFVEVLRKSSAPPR